MGRQKKEYLHSKIMTGVDLHSKTSYQKKYSEHGKKVINKKLLEIAKQHRSGNAIKITPNTPEYEKNKNYWRGITDNLQVSTPLESTNILLNSWLIYQTITSRLLGRTGYYQSGGAYGFRDQLQDTIALKYVDPEFTKQQIIKHSAHQFIEGDVEHWWHDETRKRHKNKIFR